MATAFSCGNTHWPRDVFLVIATLLTFMARQRDLLEEDRRLELAESEAHYRTLLRQHEGVAIVQNNSIAESNPNFAALFDFTLHEVIGTPLHRYLFYRPNPGIDSTESLPLDVVRGVSVLNVMAVILTLNLLPVSNNINEMLPGCGCPRYYRTQNARNRHCSRHNGWIVSGYSPAVSHTISIIC